MQAAFSELGESSGEQRAHIGSTAMPRVTSRPVNPPAIVVDCDALELEVEGERTRKDEAAQELLDSIQEMHERDGNENIVDSSQNELAQSLQRPKTSRAAQDSKEVSIHAMDFNSRLNHFANKKKENTVSVAMEMLASEQAHCTFTPRVNSTSRRNLKKFLEDQALFLENKSSKIKNTQLQLIEKELMAMREGPQIDRRSEWICATKPRTASTHKKHARPAQELSPPKAPCRPKCATFVTQRAKVRSIKEMKQESEACEKKRQEELSKLQRRLKEAAIVQNKVKRELDGLFTLHAPKEPSLDFTAFCTCCYHARQRVKGFWHAQGTEGPQTGAGLV